MNNTTAFICVINNKTSTKYDEGQCIVGNIAAFLYKYDFGYICIGILGLIAVLSIFGGIKQNYRWFILNQALWDILKSYEFSCSNFLAPFVKPAKCFYYSGDGVILINLDYTFRQIILNNIYAPWVLISITRFIALYYVKFYAKLTRGYRIIFTILFFNAFFMIFDTEQLISKFQGGRNSWLLNECKLRQPLNSTLCTYSNTNDFITDLFSVIYKIVTYVRTFKPSICLLISTFATTMIIIKLLKQAKFQLQHNRRDFMSSARITTVITSQTAMNFGIFCIQFLGTVVPFFSIFSISVKTVQYTPSAKNFIDFTFPLWIDGPLGLTGLGGQQVITQSRIFIESIIVLGIMTGYREALINFFKNYIFLFETLNCFIKVSKRVRLQIHGCKSF